MAEQDNFKSSKTLKQNIVLNTIFRVLIIIAPFLTAPYVSRVLSNDGIGIYSYTQSLVTYFTMFSALGTVSYGTREIARLKADKQQYSKTFREIEMISIICSSICLVSWISLSFAYVEYRTYLLIFTFSILATAMDISWFYAGLEKYKCIVFVNLLFKIFGVVCIFVFVNQPTDLWIYILIYGLSMFLGNASTWLFLPKFLVKAKMDRKSLKKHFKETFVYFIPTIATSLYTVLDKTLIGSLIQGETTIIVDGKEVIKQTSEIENGYYEQATKIIDMVKTVAFVSIQNVAYSRASYLYQIKDEQSVKRLTLQTLQLGTFLSFGAAFGLIGISETFIPLFFGEGYEKTVILLQILATLVPIICISGTLGSLYYSPVGKRKQSSLFLIIGAVVNLAISAPLVIFFQSIGAAVASIVAELVIAILYFAYCKGAITFKELFSATWKKILSGGLMLALLLVSNIFLRPFIDSKILYLLLMVFAGAIIYVLFLLLLKDEAVLIGKNWVRRMLKKGKIND